MWRKLHNVTLATGSYRMFHNMGMDGKINKFYEKVLSTIYSYRVLHLQSFWVLYTLRSKELIKPLYQTNQIRGS